VSSCTAVVVEEDVINLILYWYYNLQLPHQDQCCFTSLCTSCYLIPWHILPQVNPAVPLRGLLHHSQLLSILVSNLYCKAGQFSRRCLLKTQERAWLPWPYLLLPAHSLPGRQCGYGGQAAGLCCCL